MVDDDGPGINPDAFDKIFERFYTDRPEQGFGQNSGLGLSISKQIIEAHRGRLWAENRTAVAAAADGEPKVLGARFTVRLPTRDDGRRFLDPRFRRAGRRARRADPGPVRLRQIAAGAGAAARRGQGLVPFARLVADDRAHVEAAHGRLLVRPAEALAGLIEVRGLGIRRLPYEPVAVVGLLVELGQTDAERLPAAGPATGPKSRALRLPRLAVAAGIDPLPLVLAGPEPRTRSADLAVREAVKIAAEALYIRAYGMPLTTCGRAVYCNAATHYNRSPSP